MPVYYVGMSMKGDSNNLDFVTRQRLRGDSESRTAADLLVALIIFAIGIVVGSTIHDSVFHTIEQVMK